MNGPTAELSVSALQKNARYILRRSLPATPIAVVKDDAYGHGALPVCRILYCEGIRRFAVARIEEAGIRDGLPNDCTYLILSPTDPKEIDGLLTPGTVQVVPSLDYARALSEKCPKGKTVAVAIKLDCGMNRLGFPIDDPRSEEEIEGVFSLRGLKPVFLYTHLPDADDPEGEAERRIDSVHAFCDRLTGRGISLPRAIANSAALLRFGSAGGDFTRPGLLLYGYSPLTGQGAPRQAIELDAPAALSPVMKLSAPILQVKALKAGERVGYGGTFCADSDCRIATVGIGYGDGLPRAAEGGFLTVNGADCPLIGRICMDLCTVLLPGNLKVTPHRDRAYLFGHTADSLPKLAEAAGTIPYEVLSRIGGRVKRVWDGEM